MYNLGPLVVNKKVAFVFVGSIMILTIFVAGFFLGTYQATRPVCKPEALNFSLFWDAYQKLQQSFASPEKLTDDAVIYGAISGMTRNLGDPYTDFFDPKQAEVFKQDLSGSFSGIGVEIGLKQNKLTVIAPLKDTPGDKAGLRAGDQIVGIDGKSTFSLAVDEAVRLIRGQEGQPVVLTVFRESWGATKEITIIRAKIKLISIDWELKNENIAYIRIHQFDRNLSDDFKNVAREILASPAKKIVLDLRNNPGGYLDVSQQIAGWFLEKGQIITIEDFGRDRERQNFLAEGNSAFSRYPIVVLINNGSASASEILAGALRDNRNISLIGEKSFGKGSVQELIELQDGASFLKITVAKWLTPKGDSISDVGLSPDIEVIQNEDETDASIDAQLAKALEIITGLK